MRNASVFKLRMTRKLSNGPAIRADRILQKRNLIAEFLVFADYDQRRRPCRNVRSDILWRNGPP